MTKSDKIREFALSVVGSAYVWGGTGEKCTPAYRRARIQQYPGQEKNIRTNCPVLSGKQSSCEGCKHHGKLAYDCAQVTQDSAQAAGISIPSGASSQWNKVPWVQRGTIDTLPMGKVCLLYRESAGSSPMGHTGVYLGDGTTVDARGYSLGTVHQSVEDHPWTHWGMLPGTENDPPRITEESEKETAMNKYKVTGNNLALRAMRSTSSAVLVRMPTGTAVEGVPYDSEWVRITYKGKTGYAMVKYLKLTAAAAAPEANKPSDAEKLDILWNWYTKEVDSNA